MSCGLEREGDCGKSQADFPLAFERKLLPCKSMRYTAQSENSPKFSLKAIMKSPV